MAYNENIPQATDTLQQSQGDLLANFAAIKTLIDVNHGTFGAATEGKHLKLEMPNLGAAQTFTGDDIGLFANTATLTTQNELYIKHPGISSAIPFTASEKSTTGWTYLPSGILMKWGVGGGGPGLYALSFPVAATTPVFNNIYTVLITTSSTLTSDTNTFVRLVDFSTTQVRVYTSQRTSTSSTTAAFKYLAIGD